MNTRKLSDKQEKRLARNIGGRQVIGSGSTPFLKGDVITSDLFIEAKTKAVESKSISVKKAWLEKAQEQAYSMRKKDYEKQVDVYKVKLPYGNQDIEIRVAVPADVPEDVALSFVEDQLKRFYGGNEK